MRNRLLLLGAGASVALVMPLFLEGPRERVAKSEDPRVGRKLPPALAQKLAHAARFSPGSLSDMEERAGGPGAQDWLEHATPGDDIPFSAFAIHRRHCSPLQLGSIAAWIVRPLKFSVPEL